ncbi:MAG: 50S ribosomal protein L13 [Candidatus Paceibacterota bacterium]|jgi:large subunit ribosomal protein L13
MKKINKKIEEEKIIDATGKALGRLASEVAVLLLGKNKTSFKRNVYSGVPVKIVNASKIRFTFKKLEEIVHKRHSGYPGGQTIITGTEIVEKKGYKELVKHAIQKMLPDNKLRREMIKNLKIEE